MRRTIPLTVAVLAAVIALTVGVGIGQPIGSQGGPPSDVFTQETRAVCSADNGDLLAQELTLTEESHLLVYFTGQWFKLGVNERGYLWFRLDGTDTESDSATPGHRDHVSTGIAMWTIPNVAPGTHIVSAHSAVIPIPPRTAASADVRGCGLTVFVIPAT